MDLSSFLAALPSRGVPSVTRTNIQAASAQGCTPGLAGPEPSSTFINPGEHLHGSRGYLNVVPAGPIPSLAPHGIPVHVVGPQEVTISLPLCCAFEALRGFPWSSPVCRRRSRIARSEAIITKIPVHRNRRMAGFNQPIPLAEVFRSLEAP